jgi:hypothetical protein
MIKIQFKTFVDFNIVCLNILDNKGIKYGVLFGSVGQYVGLSVETISHPVSATALYNSIPLVVTSLEPQWVCVAWNLPPIMKRMLILSNSVLCSFA